MTTRQFVKAIIVAATTTISAAAFAGQLTNPEIEKRIDDLLGRMTVEEKLVQLASAYPNSNARLGIPQLQSGEALHGVCLPGGTSYPQSIGLGATWDPDLVGWIGVAIGREGRALGMHQCFAPMLGLARDPRWGRVEESYGEDAWHVSRMAVAYINGVQGKGADRFGKDHMICTPKHFAADGDSMRGGNAEAVEISEQTLRETALIPFEAAVKEARTGSIMPAHHALNRIPCHVNKWLLQDVLRKEWGFDGFITSDFADIAKNYNYDVASGHYIARSFEEAGAMSLVAGVDMELMGTVPWDAPRRTYGAQMVEGVKAGRIPVEAVDIAVRNVLRAKFQLGLFDGTPASTEEAPKSVDGLKENSEAFDPWAEAVRKGSPTGMPMKPRPDARQIVESKEHQALALEAAQKAIVLLKNDGGLLPLDKAKLRKIAVIGPNANEAVLGGYTGKPRYTVNILEGIKKLVGDKVEVGYAKGCSLLKSKEDNIAAAVELAKNSEVSVVVVGTARSTMGENLDRADLDLTGSQQELVEAIQATGKPVVVVLVNGGALAIPWLQEHVPAIIEGWYGGQEAGTAIAQVLFGEVNPGGKLPVTFPYMTGMVPCYYNSLPPGGPQKYIEGQFRVLYPFGHGLTYTKFEFDKPKLSAEQMPANDTATLTVKVTNTGQRAGDEVVQLYLKRRYASTVRPVEQLIGFQRITLQPGESREVSLPVGFMQLRSWLGGKWIVEPGEFTLMAGPDSAHGQEVVLTVQ